MYFFHWTQKRYRDLPFNNVSNIPQQNTSHVFSPCTHIYSLRITKIPQILLLGPATSTIHTRCFWSWLFKPPSKSGEYINLLGNIRQKRKSTINCMLGEYDRACNKYTKTKKKTSTTTTTTSDATIIINVVTNVTFTLSFIYRPGD